MSARAPAIPRRSDAVIVVFYLGLLAKSMVATLPFVLLLLDYWPLGRLPTSGDFPLKRLVIEKIPLFALSAGSCVVTALRARAFVPDARLPLLERIGNAVVSYVVYLRQMIFPAGLAAPYPIAAERPAVLDGLSGIYLPGRDFRGCWRGGKNTPAC